MKQQISYNVFRLYVLVLIILMGVTSGTITASAKAYKAKTVKITSGKSKKVKTSKKIKKVSKSSKNKSFTVKKVSGKSFKVSKTDVGKTQTVKVTYTNGNTQKFKIKTNKMSKTTNTKTSSMPSYAKKIVNELKPLLADPDKGLDTVTAQWGAKIAGNRTNPGTPVFKYRIKSEFRSDGTGTWKTEEYYDMDWVKANLTDSEKQVIIIEAYLKQRTHYSMSNKGDYYKNRKSNAQLKKLYNSEFYGVCSDGAYAALDICEYLGIKAVYTKSTEMNHAWCNVWVTNKNGNSYWHGLAGFTSTVSYSMKGSYKPIKDLTKKQVKKYVREPEWQMPEIKYIGHKKNKTPVTPAPQPAAQTPAPTVAPTPAPTQAPAPDKPGKPKSLTKRQVLETMCVTAVVHDFICDGCEYCRNQDKNENLFTSEITASYDNAIYEKVVYAHITPAGIRWFDDGGTEYLDITGNGEITDELRMELDPADIPGVLAEQGIEYIEE